MTEVTISIPEELREDIKKMSKLKLSLAIARMVKPELERLAKLKGIVAKSKLTEEDVKDISEKVDTSLSKRFKESLAE